MFLGTSVRIIMRAFRQWGQNQDTGMGAGLAYYTLFSITPLLVFAIKLAGFVFDETQARENVLRQLEQTTDQSTVEAIKTLMEHARKPAGDAIATAVSIAVLVVGALGMFLHCRTSLSRIWKLTPPRDNSYLGLLVDYALALLMVFVTGLLLLASLAISTALPFVIEFMKENVPELNFPWRLIEMALSFLLLMLLFATIYRVLSGYRIPWHYVWYGSMISSLLFTVGKTLMGLYLAYFSPASVYGAAGSVMVFLLWVYYSSLILFFGAELIQARRTRHEWMNAQPTPAV